MREVVPSHRALLRYTAGACRRAYWTAPLPRTCPLAVGSRIKTRADFHATHRSWQ